MTTQLTIHRIKAITSELTRQDDFDCVKLTVVCEDGETQITLFPWSNHQPTDMREEDCEQGCFGGFIFDSVDDRRTK